METIFPTTAGWVTNRRSGCVQLAFEWAILRMTESGDIGRWRNAWLTETACSATTELATGQSGRRARDRQLSELVDAGAPIEAEALWWPHDLMRSAPTMVGRRLRGSRDTASAEGGGDAEDVRTLTVVDFSGMFLMFAIVTLLTIIGFFIIPRCRGFCARQGRRLCACLSGSKGKSSITITIDSVQNGSESPGKAGVVKALGDMRAEHNSDELFEISKLVPLSCGPRTTTLDA